MDSTPLFTICYDPRCELAPQIDRIQSTAGGNYNCTPFTSCGNVNIFLIPLAKMLSFISGVDRLEEFLEERQFGTAAIYGNAFYHKWI